MLGVVVLVVLAFVGLPMRIGERLNDPAFTYDEGACPGFQEKKVAREAIDLDLSTNRDIQLGRWVRLDGDPHYYFDGRMAEVTIFDRTLTTGEVDTVEEYMSSEYGIPLDGPVN